MAVTVGELKGYWKKVADAVSSNKMNVTDADILAALMAIGQTIEDVEAEIQAIKSTEGIKKIADAVDVQLTGSNAEAVWQTPLAITGTSAVFLPVMNVSDCGDFEVLVISTLNQPCILSFTQINNRGTLGYSVRDPNASLDITIPTAAGVGEIQLICRPTHLRYASTIRAFLKCSVAPTSGSIAVYVIKKGRGL